MKLKNDIKSSKGAASSILLILAIALVVIAIIVFFVIRNVSLKNGVNSGAGNSPTPVPTPVYDKTVGGVRFLFESGQDLGNVLVGKNPAFQQNLTTTERFIRLVVAAQNTGKVNLQADSWGIGNIVDSDGRNFVSINDRAYDFLPRPNLCGVLLKPNFEPTPCVMYYEVSKESTGLKVEVGSSSSGFNKGKKIFLDVAITK